MSDPMPKAGKELLELEERLSKYAGEDRILSSHEIAELLKQTDSSVFRFKTGIPSMDRILNEVESGELIVVSGPSGGGKTTLLMSITKNMVANGTKAVWFTLEVTPRQFIKKILGRNSELPLFYMPAENTENHVRWLIERIMEAHIKYNAKVVFIDHLHQIFSIDRFRGMNASLEIADIVAVIKQIAIRYNLVIFMIAHNTDDKIRIEREPKMMDIRDSGMISRLADTVMGVWRIPDTEDGRSNKMKEVGEHDTRAKVKIWKNRREGPLGHILMIHTNHELVELDLTRHEPTPPASKKDDDDLWGN